MGSETGHTDGVAIDDLRASVARVSLEVQALAGKVEDLVAAVETLAPKSSDSTPAPPAPRVVDDGDIAVTVAPLPELAMAAVAETALRGLDSVNRVVSVERSNSQATFVLGVEDGGDLVSEMRRAMPVPITVDRATDGSMKVVLEWSWGRSASRAG
ncbi:MAG: hypothetical protein KDB48_04980 [Solirubrobacterales bacterium]|nr:hypothetical protein [Solirubrobacterales bacterium]